MKCDDKDTSKNSENINLTHREMEVLKLVIKGKSNREIAQFLVITHHTVKAHVSAILRKFGVKSRVEAVVLALSSKICD